VANALYASGREGFLDGSINWETGDIRAALIDTGVYTVNLATHKFYSAISGVLGTYASLRGKTVTNGKAGAYSIHFTSVTGSAGAVVLVDWKGSSSTSRLIAYIDTATGLPASPSSQDVNVGWPTPIFTL